MPEIPASIFLNYFLFLLLPFICGYVVKRFKLPPLIGYLAGGIVLGNVFSNAVHTEIISGFANLGIMLLLFTVGLEINFSRMVVLRKFIIAGGLLQLGITAAGVAVLNLLFGFTLSEALLGAVALASSSTVLVTKIIQDRGEESSFVGELATGLLMLQDLCFVPFLIMVTYLSRSASPIAAVQGIAVGLIETAAILVIMYYGGRIIVPRLFDRIARTSRELLNLFIIMFVFFIAWLSSYLHIPALVGMFIAGVLVSQTLEHHHIFTQIRPLRDFTAIIFFVFMGMNMAAGELFTHLPQIIVYAVLYMLVKVVIFIGIALYLRLNTRIAFSLGLYLFQASEGAFILLGIAGRNGAFDDTPYVIVTAAVMLSLIATPILITYKDATYELVRRLLKKRLPFVEMYIKNSIDFSAMMLEDERLENHVVICGYGRVGSYVGRALTLANIPFIAIDYSFHTVEKAKRDGVHIIYGDPTDPDILEFAGISRAVALVSVVPERFVQETIVLNAKKSNRDIIVISRVHLHEHQQRMRDLGVDIVVQPELEASVSIIKKLFMIKQLTREEMVRRLHHFKVEQGVA